MKPFVEKIKMFFFKILFPRKYKLYLKIRVEEKRLRTEEKCLKIEEEKRREEERKNIEKFAMVGGAEIRDKITKDKWDNTALSLTFYLRKKSTRRVIVVKGSSFEDVKREYGEEYDFIEPMIKNAAYEWGELGGGPHIWRYWY